MKRLKKSPQVLRSSKTQRDTKNRAGHKKPSGIQKTNARPKTQRHVKNLPELEKPPRVGKTSPSWKNLPELEKPSNTRFEEYFSLKHHHQGSNWILLTLTNVQSNVATMKTDDLLCIMWRTIRFEKAREYISRIRESCCKLSRPYPSHLLNDSQTEGHDGTIRYRLVILAQCGNSRVWGGGEGLRSGNSHYTKMEEK